MASTDLPAGQPVPEASAASGNGNTPCSVPVGIGRRVVVVANLAIGSRTDPGTAAAAAGVIAALDAFEGPGIVIVAGNLFDLVGRTAACPTAAVDGRTGPDRPDGHATGAEAASPADLVRTALLTHADLAESFRRFAAGAERRLLVLPGVLDDAIGTDPGAREAVRAIGAEVTRDVDLHLATAAGTKIVRVVAGRPAARAWTDGGAERGAFPLEMPVDAQSAPWSRGADRLSDPALLHRFLTSRLLYRRMARYAWWLLVPFLVVAILSLPIISTLVAHVSATHPGPAKALRRVTEVSLSSRLLVASLVAAVALLASVASIAVLSRRTWETLSGAKLRRRSEDDAIGGGTTANDDARDDGRALVAAGFAGLVTGTSLEAELTDLGAGFFACAGACGEVVEEHPGRLGLPPVFLHHHQVAWVELETGAGLHARLLLARSDAAPATRLERIAARHRTVPASDPVIVAAYPHGASWPPAPDLSTLRRRSRRVRRIAAAAIAVAGIVDLITAATPPLRSHLRLLLEVLPLSVPEFAGALVALAGVALLALARGVRRGQHRAWLISVVLLAGTLVLHVARGTDVVAWLFSAAVLAGLLVYRAEFRAQADRPSLRSAFWALVGGSIVITLVTTVAVDLGLHIRNSRAARDPLWRIGLAVVERLVGIQTVHLPRELNEFLAPALSSVGIALAVVALWLLTRPVVDRRRSLGRAAEARARDIVNRHGSGTLDYFALRSDKQQFFHRDSVVAYGIFGGVCLVSPDPIGPPADRVAVWSAFRRFADAHGWVVTVMGASEAWLPIYRATGMHDIYIGDEAVVDVQKFALSGGHMKGLRQAFNRIAKYGYTATFHDPSHLDPGVARRLAGLMAQSRRGQAERGFSMMLGRIFSRRDVGLLLCVVWDPDGNPAAMCQYVPAPAINGYSLDLMRRDRGEHPNGILDFALVSTIEYLRDRAMGGLSLNFAAMRSILDGERGDGVTQRAERWALKKMSSFLQIETLWRFNAKYQPRWLPRYAVYDTAEHLVPVLVAIARAESLWEVPVLGRLLAASDRRNRPAAESPDGLEAWERTPEQPEPVPASTAGRRPEPEN